jgi:hypothetical protein
VTMADAIRDWFIEHEDGEFVISPAGAAWRVIFPVAHSRRVIYTTKYQGVGEMLSEYSNPQSMGLIARYGLPSDEDVQGFRLLVGDRRLVFVGDADPSDLLIYAWLRSRLEITYRGLSDSLLKQCGVAIDPRITLQQSPDEWASMAFLTERLPEWADLVGPQLAEVVRSGKKIEAEVLAGFATVTVEAMFDAL